METYTLSGLRRAFSLAIVVASIAAMLTVTASPASAVVGDILDPPEPPSEECKVPQHLWTVAAQVDADSLEGCDYFEDPNYHENRKANGTYNPNGPFSLIFG